MKIRLAAIVSLLLASMVAVSAQNAKTGRLAVQAASAALGVPGVKSIQYTGAGWVAAVGQSYSIDEDWPRFQMPSYVRSIDYDARFSREELVEEQGSYPARGGETIQGQRRKVSSVSGEYAWNLENNVEVPAVDEAERRQLDIWLSPHGFLKAAAEASAKGLALNVDGREVTLVTFRALGKYTVNGTINDRNLVERVQTWVADPAKPRI
jgi:hypothetical protein